MTTIRLVTVTHNSSGILDAFLRNVGRGMEEGDELIVVDSGSLDVASSRAIVARHNARLIETRQNVGYGAGTNLGARLARDGWIAIVNPDVRVSFTDIRRLVDTAIRHDIACLGPRIVSPQGIAAESSRGSISPPWRRRRKTPSVRKGGLTLSDSISGCCMVMPASFYHALRGFDEYFFMFCEEIDLQYRARRAGGVVASTSSVTVVTQGGSSSSTTSRRWSVTERSVAHVRYIHKHFTCAEAMIDFLWRCLEILRGGEFVPRRDSLRQLARGVFSRR